MKERKKTDHCDMAIDMFIVAPPKTYVTVGAYSSFISFHFNT